MALILISIYAFAHLSGGHFNPAVTITTLATQKITLVRCLFYILAQLMGAVTGAGFCRLAFPSDTLGGAPIGVFAPAANATEGQAGFYHLHLSFSTNNEIASIDGNNCYKWAFIWNICNSF